jgi:quercetin dioxygenase-like cupin family protein
MQTATPSAMQRDPVSKARYTFERHDDQLVVETWLEPGGALPPHYHPQQEEIWSVVDGEVRFRHGRTTRVIRPDDGEVRVAPNEVHGLESCTDRDAHLRCRVTPPLHLQEFLEEAARAGEQGLFTQRGLPRGLRGARWAARFLKRHRDETVFVSPPPVLQRALFALFARDVSAAR